MYALAQTTQARSACQCVVPCGVAIRVHQSMCCPALQRKQAQAHCKWGRTPDTRSHRPMVRAASLSCIRKHLPGWGPLAVWAPRRLGGHVHRPRLPWLALPRRHGGSASARGRPQARSRSAVDQQCHIQCTCLTHPRFCFNGGRTHRSSIRIGYTGHLIRCVRCGRGKRHQVGPWVVTAAAHTKSSVQPSQTRSATRPQCDLSRTSGALMARRVAWHLCVHGRWCRTFASSTLAIASAISSTRAGETAQPHPAVYT